VGKVHVIFHLITDTHGTLLAWIKAAPATQAGPRLVIRPAHPNHILHENVETDAECTDRAGRAVALQSALTERVRRHRPQGKER
jgi:hypothetical protein